MEFGEDEKIRLPANEFESSVHFCRICHEEEDENSPSMESPCSCSGTLKFAHRRCIQRWCDEKGNNVCEICLRRFEPGYAVILPPAKPHFDAVVTVSENLEEATSNNESEINTILFITTSEHEREYIESSRASDRRARACRFIVLMFTIILFVKHLFALLCGNAEDYAFTLATVLILRAMGILLPFCLLMRLITVIHKAEKLQLADNVLSGIQRVEDDLEQQ